MTGEFAVAVHAIVFLNHKQKVLSSEELAKNVCTNPARIRKVMAKLKKGGLIVTKGGVEGGYSFEKDAATVTLEDICQALDIKIISSNWKSGNPDMDCMVASGMAGIMDDIYQNLNELCQQKLRSITIKTIDNQIFQAK